MENFNSKTVALEGVNLVEASAGTGKTYSVAILVLRLIIEKNVPINRVLMVTFTNAAVAEMAHRIRKFLRLGIQAASGIPIDESNIRGYIQDKITELDPKEIIHRLNQALIGLDEASIQTIHSFCQDSLKLFALETGQAFGLKLQEDLSDLVSLTVEDFWRNEVTGFSKDYLAEMHKGKITLKILRGALLESLGGKEFDFQGDFLRTYEDFLSARAQLFEDFESYKNQYKTQILSRNPAGHFNEKAKNELLSNLDKGALNLGKWLEGSQQYKQKIREEVFSNFFPLYQAFKEVKNLSLKCLIYHGIQFSKNQIKSYLEKNHLLTYDEMITRLHHAVSENRDLVAKLSDRFDAVVIDEFQDTDKLQYEIYDTLYGANKLLFYIGDPKQSIYGWRKADLSTYFKASTKEGVRRYTMGSNFRSTPDLLASLNEFFAIDNPFLSGNIPYLPVSSGINKPRKGVSKKDILLEPIHIYNFSTKGEIPEKVLSLIKELLEDGTQVNGRQLKLSDVAILVRTKREGKEIKQALARKGIPAVNVDETKIFETEEAEYLEYMLQTTLEISWKGVNKALLNKFTGWKAEDLLIKDSDQLVSKFKEYQALWADLGVYAMIRKYIQEFGVINHLFNPQNPSGKRVYSNLTQLMEILQEAEYRQELKPSGLLSFLQKHRSSEAFGEDSTYLQRLEDDQEAITIMTIHKSKGLEFPIVIAPYLNLKPSSKFDFASYRKVDGTYCFFSNALGPEEDGAELFNQQSDEENRRLLYVALTRAVFNCFIFHVASEKDQTLAPFVKEVPDRIKVFSVDQFPYPKVEGLVPMVSKIPQTLVYQETPELKLPDHNWRKLSFSYLTRKVKPLPKFLSLEYSDSYEEFIFKKMPKGASIGDLLHYLFERIDFQDQTAWEPILKKAIGRFYPQFGEEMKEHFLELLNQVVTTSIPQVGPDFSLDKLGRDKKTTEWEFDLKSEAFEPAALMAIPAEEDFIIRSVEGKALQGILNGLVDLIFEYQGKYYILDWKSNFLGDSLEDYHYEGLLEAMNANNYHLQYLLYTLALKQFLEKHQKGFDYERDFGGVVYLFLRGIRKGRTTGIFSYKPSMNQIQFLEKLILPKELSSII